MKCPAGPGSPSLCNECEPFGSAYHPRVGYLAATSRAFSDFVTPLATSSAESGRPGLTTPGTFRPWAFSALRRFTPPRSCPFYFTRAPLMGFKERDECLVVTRALPASPRGDRRCKSVRTTPVRASSNQSLDVPLTKRASDSAPECLRFADLAVPQATPPSRFHEDRAVTVTPRASPVSLSGCDTR